MNKAEELAKAHWSYIEDLLRTHGEDEETLFKIGFHYKTAFEHGYKHALEEVLGVNKNTPTSLNECNDNCCNCQCD